MAHPAIGCMRLSNVDREQALAVLGEALERGVRTLDTADVYGPTHRDRGHNELLIREVLATWTGPPVRVVTKGGLARRATGPWQVDGRRKHLLAAAEASAERLGRPPDLYLLHAPPTGARLDTAVRALKAIHDRGLADAVGVCNVRLGELRRARELAPIAAIQVALSPVDDTSLRSGAIPHALRHGLEVLVHSPFGGPRKSGRLARLAPLPELARALDTSPWAVVLGWLESLGLQPLPGPTTVDHLRDLHPRVALPAAALAALDEAFPGARILRIPESDRRPPRGAPGDVVLLMGSPASGKSTEVKPLEERGYLRLNRDTNGGSLAQVAQALDRALADGHREVVLDNTYPSRAQRNRVIETAWTHGVPVRCLYKDTGLEEARLNACVRMVQRHGRLLEPDEMKRLSRSEPNSFPPRVLLQWPGKLEEPEADEGFTTIQRLPFSRRPLGPARAVIVDANRVEPSDRPALEARAADGWLIFAVGWSGGGPAPGDVSVDGLRLETLWCTHPPGPPICWCRPPLPGLAATLMVRHGVGTAIDLDGLRG